MERKLDPRTIVTPYAFAVHPELLGMPLATPWQRFGAIAVDGLVIFFLSLVGLGPLAIATTALLFWLATRKPNRDTVGKFFKIAVGCLGFMVLGATALVIFLMNYDPVQEALEEVGDQVEAVSMGVSGDEAGDEAGDPNPGLADVAQGVFGAMALQSAENEEDAQTIVNRFVQGSHRAGIPQTQIRELVRGIIPEDAGWASSADEIVDRAMATLSGSAQEAPEIPAPDDSTAEGEDTPLSALAVDSIENLNQELVDARQDLARARRNTDDLQEALEQTNTALEEERGSSPFGWLLSIIDDLGIGFGWAAIYLTITHAWWKGTSIGKKFFRIRVVMIDKRPLNWWLSFERAGGYAAGFATGLLGFAQIFWDPNRQAIHDKVSETIVIKDGVSPVSGPWIQEGKDQWARGHQGPMKEKPQSKP